MFICEMGVGFCGSTEPSQTGTLFLWLNEVIFIVYYIAIHLKKNKKKIPVNHKRTILFFKKFRKIPSMLLSDGVSPYHLQPAQKPHLKHRNHHQARANLLLCTPYCTSK